MNLEESPFLLFDLLNKRTALLLRRFDACWAAEHAIVLSSSEWLILSKALEFAPSIADVAKSVPITRQATHKCIKALEAKGLITTALCSKNKRVKLVMATPLGKQYHCQSVSIKREIENELLASMGREKISTLKNLLYEFDTA